LFKRGFSIDQVTLQRLFDAHGLGEVRSVEWAGLGRNNPALIINDALVVRFDGIINEGVSRFQGEARAYAALNRAGVPAPHVLVVDDSATLFPQHYLIMTKLEGMPLIQAWSTLAPHQREEAARQAGELLAKMHGVTFERFGKLYGTERIFGTWREYIEDYFNRYTREAADDGLIAPVMLQRMETTMAQHARLLDSVTTPRLVHWDYHFENLLYKDGAITGMLDFEWALAGDADHDFNRRNQWDDDCPGSRAPLYAGYTSIRPLDADHEARVAFYQMLWYVDCVVDAYDTAEADTYRDKLKNVMDVLA
jgi:aminoglycoside phosphotransferase (APT) family kinase protein